MEKPRVTVGVVGHPDHDKTTLMAALAAADESKSIDFVEIPKSEGVVIGSNDNSFQPEDGFTQEQLKMIERKLAGRTHFAKKFRRDIKRAHRKDVLCEKRLTEQTQSDKNRTKRARKKAK